MAKPEELAVLIVDGMYYRDWESVWVKHAYQEPFAMFKFTCSEGMPLASNFAYIRIKPGDDVDITLAGEPAIQQGRVYSRQVSYSARHHNIEIQGAARPHALAQGSIAHKTGEFKDATFEQISKAVMQPFGINLKTLGQLSQDKFKRIHVQQGETPWDLVERIARSRGIVLGNDGSPNLLAMGSGADGGGGGGGGGNAVIEGKNILEAREQLVDKRGAGGNLADASQLPGTDDESMAQITHMPFHKMPIQGGFGAVARPFLNYLTMGEVPSRVPDLKHRNTQEDWARNNEQVHLDVVVQGWLCPAGGLWKVGTKVYVKSPMLIMDRDLWLKSATFTQDNQSGTRTSLELVDTLGENTSVEPSS